MTMGKPRSRIMLCAVAGLLVLGGCGGNGGDGDDTGGGGDEASGDVIEVVAEDFEFDPAELEVPEGEVTVRLVNRGTVPHTFTLEENSSVDTGNVAPGESKMITFTAPTEDSDFICTIHYESQDMEGLIRPA